MNVRSVLRLASAVSLFGMAAVGWAAQQGDGQSYPVALGGGGGSLPAGCEYYGTVVRGSDYYGSKALLGLAAKGNIVVGDYTSPAFQQDVVEMIDRDGAGDVTRPYAVDPSSENLGYNNGGALCGGSAYCFDGNYAQPDGGVKNQKDINGDYVERQFYESSLADADFSKLVQRGGAVDLVEPHSCFGGESHPDCSTTYGSSTQVQAVLYANHGFIGQVGRSEWHGAVVARDDALRFQGRLDMVYDWRLQDAEISRKIGLPLVPVPARVVSWEEVSPQ